MAAKAKKTRVTGTRSGPRAPAGKRPLTVIVDEKLSDDAKIAAIRKKTNVSRVVQELLEGWLSGLYELRNEDGQ